MEIVTLYGKGNKGKSTALLMLIAKVLKSYDCKEIIPPKNPLTVDGIKSDLHDRTLGGNGAAHDETVKLEINGKLVGITTFGDTEDCIDGKFKRLADCDIVFCAARSRGRTLKYIERKEKAGAKVIWYTQIEFSCGDYSPASAEYRFSRYCAIADVMSDFLLNELNMRI